MVECLLCQCEKFSGVYGLIFVVVSIRKHMHNILSIILRFVHPLVMVRCVRTTKHGALLGLRLGIIYLNHSLGQS